MIQISKIEDTSLNLDVRGQGCWSDCYHGGHWELKTTVEAECSYYGAYYDMITNPFS